MDRIDTRLRELNQELIETRNLTIKTDHAVRNLAGDMRELTKMQEAFQKRTLWSSGTAYVLFVVLSFGGLFLFFRAASSSTSMDESVAAEQLAQLGVRITELEEDLERRRDAEKEAWGFYELLERGSPEEVVERFPGVQSRLVDRASVELFRREVDRLRQQLASDAFADGMRAYAASRWSDARESFQRSLNYREFAPYTPELNYHLGDALFHLNDHATATRYYNTAIASGELSRDLEPLATYRLAESLRAMGRDREALDVYKVFPTRFPNHPWRSAAETRAAALLTRIGAAQPD